MRFASAGAVIGLMADIEWRVLGSGNAFGGVCNRRGLQSAAGRVAVQRLPAE